MMDRARVAHRAFGTLRACAEGALQAREALPDARKVIDQDPVTEARAREKHGVRFDTPWELADPLAVAFTDGRVPAWWGDPCCGVGRLLVASLDAWVRRGLAGENLAALRAGLVYGDVDADAVEVADAALAVWAARTAQGLAAAGRVDTAAALARAALDAPAGDPVDVFDREHLPGGWIVTNPPFESIRALHKRLGRKRVEALKARFEECRGAFDTGVPVVAQCARWAANGRLALVAPSRWRSVEYAVGLRRTLAAMGPWTRVPAPSRSFNAAVDTMLVCSGRIAVGEPINWSEAEQPPLGTLSLGELAVVRSGTPGFHADAVAEALSESEPDEGWPFVSAGSITSWSVEHTEVRLCGRTFEQPYLPRLAIESDARRALYDQPKIVVPGVARGVEAAWDAEGSALSVGVVAVVPHQPAHRGLLLAALNAPWSTSWLERALPGRGLSGGYRRVGARQVARLPVPDPSRQDVAAILPELDTLATVASGHGESAVAARRELNELVTRLYAVATRPVAH